MHHLADAADRCRSALNPLSLTNFGFMAAGREEEHGSKNNKRKRGEEEVKSCLIKMAKVRSNEIMDVYLLPRMTIIVIFEVS